MSPANGLDSRQRVLKIGIGRLLRQKSLHDFPALLGGTHRLLGLAQRQQRVGRFVQRSGLAATQAGICFARTQQLGLQISGAIENIFDRRGRQADNPAEFLRQVEYQAVRCSRRQCQSALGTIALLLGDLAFLHGDPPLPVGKAGEHERDDEPGGKASGENIAPPGCPRGGSRR